MTAQERYNYFDPNNWAFERRSGFAGSRHLTSGKWLYESELHEGQVFRREYEAALKLLHDFRSECLPFGQYPDGVIMEFLEKHFEAN